MTKHPLTWVSDAAKQNCLVSFFLLFKAVSTPLPILLEQWKVHSDAGNEIILENTSTVTIDTTDIHYIIDQDMNQGISELICMNIE